MTIQEHFHMDSSHQMIGSRKRLSKSSDTLSCVIHADSLSPTERASSSLCQSTPELPVACRRSASPRHQSIWRRRITRMKADLSEFGRCLRHSFTESLDRSLVTRIVPDIGADGHDVTSGARPRRITVAYSSGSKSGSGTLGSHDDSDLFDEPDHNLSSSLVLKSLKDGRFSAEVSLGVLPPGDLLLYIRGHELEVILERTASGKDKKHHVTIPSHQGLVELPIFADVNSLTFIQDSKNDSLLITGSTKGCLSRRRSLSLGVLPSKSNSKTLWKTFFKKLGFRRAKSQDSITKWNSTDEKIYKNNLNSDILQEVNN